jgi:glutamate/tyrosine decarboxylase-like PLP-dependent enzyme
MNQVWVKKTQDQLKEEVFKALEENVSYTDKSILGVPASYLNDKVFNQDVSFLKDAPFLKALVQNPNHIGCHTLGESESFFAGTHAIEKELIEICAVDILKGEKGAQDGYIASGGTEANIQAIWIYRNYFQQELQAQQNEIAIICSEDSHYSMDKASNLLSVDLYKFVVDKESRLIKKEALTETIALAKADGKKYFIFVANMMTTMFGSVDDITLIAEVLKEQEVIFKIHVDGAYGGFYYPFSNEESLLNFNNPIISSFTLDAHKMAQSPYGTGIFLIRKGLIQYVNTKEASYVEGEDFTLIGSRSGANAIAVWMILCKNGPFGWYEKIFILQKRAEWLSKQLDQLNIEYYRNSFSNIITIKSKSIEKQLAEKYYLVPDNHANPKWYKVVIMEHVTVDLLILLVQDLAKN